MSDPHLLYRVQDNIARFTINREPQRNAISLDAVALFLSHLDEASADPNVRVISITGAGEKAFCSGADLASATDGKIERGFGHYAALLKKLAGYSKPTLARVNGACMAGGMGLMLACDIVIATDEAVFGTPEVKVGLWPMMIGALIYRNVLRKKAMKIGKEAFYAMGDMPFEEAVDFLSKKISEVASTEDAAEGITAFIEKRQPVFKGK